MKQSDDNGVITSGRLFLHIDNSLKGKIQKPRVSALGSRITDLQIAVSSYKYKNTSTIKYYNVKSPLA